MLLTATELQTTLNSPPLHILTEPTNARCYYYVFHYNFFLHVSAQLPSTGS